METQLNKEELKKIQEGIRDKFSKVAVSPEGLFEYPTGKKGLEKLKYDEKLIEKLPDEVIASYCGVGNPFSLGEIHQGEMVLDVGCGAGVDSIIAGLMVGPEGSVDGVDVVPEIIARAEKNLSLTTLHNVNFHTSTGEKLPFGDSTFDVITSNGVINLIPDKEAILKEIFRVLKPEGRLLLADQVAVGSIKTDMKARLANWFQWEGGTIPGRDFLALIKKIGFQYVELVGETGFNSTPKTKGVLVRATKSAESPKYFQSSIIEDQPAQKIVVPDQRVPRTLEAVIEKAYALGCEEAKIIDTTTVVVEKWVRWKCLYGCPMYNKDGCHPPYAPGADETKEVLSEYTKAVLLKGPKGKELTDIAVNLEGEAYKIGFYKAFALTAIPSGAEVESAPGATWPSGEDEGPCDLKKPEVAKNKIRPMMEACGIDVFQTVRNNGFEIDTQKVTYGRWSYFALVLIEWILQENLWILKTIKPL